MDNCEERLREIVATVLNLYTNNGEWIDQFDRERAEEELVSRIAKDFIPKERLEPIRAIQELCETQPIPVRTKLEELLLQAIKKTLNENTIPPKSI